VVVSCAGPFRCVPVLKVPVRGFAWPTCWRCGLPSSVRAGVRPTDVYRPGSLREFAPVSSLRFGEVKDRRRDGWPGDYL